MESNVNLGNVNSGTETTGLKMFQNLYCYSS